MRRAAVLAVLILLGHPAPLAGQGEVLDFRTALARAASREAGVRQAQAVWREAQAAQWEAAGRLLPEFSATTSYQRNLQIAQTFLPAVLLDPDAAPDVLVPVRFGADNVWQAQLAVTVPVVDFGAWLGWAGARAVEDAAALRHADAVRTARVATATAYLDLLLASEVRYVADASVSRARQVSTDIDARYAAGLASPYDVARLRVQARSAATAVVAARSAVESAGRALALLTDGDPGIVYTPAGRLLLEDPARLDALLAGTVHRDVPARALPAERPDLLAADVTAAAERRAQRAVLLAGLPRLSVFGILGITAQQNGAPDFFGTSGRQRATSMAAGVRLELPLVGAGLFARAAGASARLARLEAERDARRAAAEAELADLLAAAADAADILRARAAERDAALQGFAIAQSANARGGDSRLDVLDANRVLLETDAALARAVHGFLTTRLLLDAATNQDVDVDMIERWLRTASARPPVASAR